MWCLADTLKALGDESRLKIVKMLQEGKLPVGEIAQRCGLSQPTVSYHFKILKQVGIAINNRDGKWIYYNLNPDIFVYLALFMQYLEKGAGSASAAVSNSPDETYGREGKR